MWGTLLGILSLTVVLITAIILYIIQEKNKNEVYKKLNGVVNQINDSQFYEYKFDKEQDGNLQNVDKNITTLYDSVVDSQKNLKYLELSAIKKEDAAKNLTSANVKANVLQLGDKFSLSGVGDSLNNDDWLRLLNKNGSDYYGGLATKQLWTRDNAYLNGNTTITGSLNANGLSTFKGGKSDMNPNNLSTYLPHIDGKNYIRGDTEIKGHIAHNGILSTDNIKIGHAYKNDWTDTSPLTAKTSGGKAGASFGGETYWSHFPWGDGNTYIRPGSDGKGIIIGDIGNPFVRIGSGSWFPYTDGNTYIRPGSDGKNIMIGDAWAANVNIGKGDTNVNINGPLNANNITTNEIVFGPDNTDPYSIKKMINGFNSSSLRVTINDDADESFEIWGDRCAEGNCVVGTGKPKMIVRADGKTQINGSLVICDRNGNNCRNI